MKIYVFVNVKGSARVDRSSQFWPSVHNPKHLKTNFLTAVKGGEVIGRGKRGR